MELIQGQGLEGVCWGPVAHCQSGGLNFCAHCQLDLSNVTLECDDEKLQTRETGEKIERYCFVCHLYKSPDSFYCVTQKKIL